MEQLIEGAIAITVANNRVREATNALRNMKWSVMLDQPARGKLNERTLICKPSRRDSDAVASDYRRRTLEKAYRWAA